MADGIEARTDGPPGPPSGVEFARAAPRVALSGLVTGFTGYREFLPGHFRQSEAASLTIPLVISFGEPFAIALGRAPGGIERYGSFAAGLFAGPVTIDSFGASHCLQVDFTPLGARRFFGLPMTELADRMVALDDVLGRPGLDLRERLADALDWSRRFEIAQAFVADRFAAVAAPRREVGWAFERIVASGGRARIESIAGSIGWSRKHLAACFARDVGLGPKAVARIVRFNRAFSAARSEASGGWAGVAADCGYADQAHLVREFSALAGMPPTALMPQAMAG